MNPILKKIIIEKAAPIAKKVAIYGTIATVLIIVFLSDFIYDIFNMDASYNDGDLSNVPYMVSNYISNLKIEDGSLKADGTVEDLWDELINQGSSIKNYLEGPEELDELINAEIITQYPKFNNDSDYNGLIEFNRKKGEDFSTLKYMDYNLFKEYVTSNNEKVSDNENIQDYFSIDESENLVIATISKTTYKIETNDSDATIESLKNEGIETGNLLEINKTDEGYYIQEVNIREEIINYKSAITQYTMPFQYLWSLLIMGQDKDFVLELADLVQNSTIVISILDDKKTTENIYTYEYKKQIRTDKYVRIKVNNDYGLSGYSTERWWLSEESPTAEQNYNSRYQAKLTSDDTEYKTIITQTYEENTVMYDINVADTWIVYLNKEYTYLEDEPISNETNIDIETTTAYVVLLDNYKSSEEDKKLLEDEDAVEFSQNIKNYIERMIGKNESSSRASSNRISNTSNSIGNNTTSSSSDNIISDTNVEETSNETEIKDVEVDVDLVWTKDYEHKVNRTLKCSNTITNSKFVEGNVTNEYKDNNDSDEPNFVNILNKSSHKAAKYNLTVDAYSWLMEVLESDLGNMVDLTKYLFYKVTGTSYGVTEFDFSAYTDVNFTTISGTSSPDQIIRFIHMWEHSTPPPTTADGTMYIIETDSVGHPTVGYGVDIEKSGYKSEFTSRGYSTNVGDTIPVELVDAVEEKILEDCIENIKALTSGLDLKQYQINALVSRAYNCGAESAITKKINGLDFVQSYNLYWNEDTDDLFTSKNKNVDFTHNLYVKYMFRPVTSDGTYLPGLEARRKSEWTLFQTGYYDVLDEWDNRMESFLNKAKEIHEYMEENKYSYCVHGTNSFEECAGIYANGTNHGLNVTFEESKTNYHHSCCATYVSWVLQECGYMEDSEHTDSANNLQMLLKQKGWKEIHNENELEPGDILSYNHHVEIYVGDNKIYNAGSGSAIRDSSPQNRSKKFEYALRAP